MQAERASQRRDVFHTNFLTPPIIKEAMLAIEKLADTKAVAQGGYPQVTFKYSNGNLLASSISLSSFSFLYLYV
jgi:hypothetical protein